MGLLALEQANFPDTCFWADEVARKQSQYRSMNALHYANVPRGQTSYDPKRDRPASGDVVSAIEKYSSILADRSKPDAERLEALRFLSHFVGDIHQPLHVGYGEDKGGNTLQVRFFDRGTNLHAVWDTGILQKSGGQWEATAKRLNDKVNAAKTRELTKGKAPLDWAQESFQVAVGQVYDGIEPGEKLGDEYVSAKLPVVEEQLAAAGVRLADVLNAALVRSGGVGEIKPASLSTPSPAATVVFVTASGRKYHRAGCKHLTETQRSIPLAEAKGHYGPCGSCRPE